MDLKRKLLAILLSLVMLTSLFAGVTASAYSVNPYPVIFVNGLATSDLINTETGERIFPFPDNGITDAVKDIIKPFLGAILTGKYEKLGEPVVKLAEALFGGLMCDENGNPALPVTYNPKDVIDLNQDFTKYYVPGVGYTTDKKITMTYDWRISPVTIAEDLHDLIEAVCASTGAEKVKLMGFSMGSSIVNSYVTRYGDDRLDTVLYIAGAYNGLNGAGEPFSGRISTSGKSIVNFLPAYMGDDLNSRLITALVDVLYDLGIADGVADLAVKIVDTNLDYAYKNGLAKLFGRWGALWAFVPYDQYEDAKAKMLPNADVSDEFIELIDYYHNEVQGKNEERINYFLENGIKFGIIAKYGYTTPPVVEDLDVNGDGVIETVYESFGATCAKAGETLGEGYVQAVQDGHNHISADNIIDASTCKFPEYTWFVKNLQHSSNSPLKDLERYIVMSDEQVDVFSSADFPQFMILTGDETLAPLTAENNVNEHTAQKKGFIDKVKGIFNLFKLLFSWIKDALSK